MPDPQHNGHHEPGDADMDAADQLSRDWDALAVQRRAGGDVTATVTDTTLVRLAELRAADTASEPRPGFLDHLERELMDASSPKITVAISPALPKLAVLPAARRRHGRGLIDVVAVAAVVALLIAGSWSIWSQNIGGPGDGTRVPGIAAGSATPNAGSDGLVALTAPWATNTDSDLIDGVAPVSTNDCTTPPRQPGSLVPAVERLDQTPALTIAEPAPQALATLPDIATYPKASTDGVVAARAFFVQFAACRFALGTRDDKQVDPFTGPYWNLYSDDALADRVVNGPRNPSFANQTPKQMIVASYQYLLQDIESSAWPQVVDDVRDVPAQVNGARQLRVRVHAVTAPDYSIDTVLVLEDGTWRFSQAAIAVPGEFSPAYQVSNIDVGNISIGPRGVSSYATQIERDTPVLMSIHNSGDVAQTVTVSGQDIGTISPGQTVNMLPFTIRSDAAIGEVARGYFRVASRPAGDADESPRQRTLTIGVYPAGTLGNRRGESAPAATPSDMPADAAGTAAATPQAGVPTVQLDVSGLDYPTVPAPIMSSLIPASDCTTPPRATGSVDAALATAPDSTDWTGGSSYFARGNVVSQSEIDALPDAQTQDHVAVTSILGQLVACRFTAGTQSDGTASFDTPYWNLFSDDYFRFNKPTLDARATVTDPAVLPFTYLTSAAGPLGSEVTDVRQLPPDSREQPRLLVELGGDIETESGGPAFAVMVQSYGSWQITQLSTLTSISSTAMPLDVFIEPDGRLGGGPFAYNYNAYGSPYIPAGLPVLLDLYNASNSPVHITISGQDLGTLAPNEERMLAPFAFPAQSSETTTLTVGMSSPDLPNLHGISFIADYGQSATPDNRRYNIFPPTPPAGSTVPAIVHPSAYPNPGSTPEAVGTPALSGTPVGQSTPEAG